MNILITGGSGFIGSALSRSLLAEKHKVWILTRDVTGAKVPEGAQALGWDGHSSQGWLDVFSEMDVVVNLAGASVGQWPWNEARKQNIRASRVQAGRAIAEAYRRSGKHPPVLIQSSGIGIYGPLGSQPVTEDAPPGVDFMASVAKDWEASTASVEALADVRRVVIRTSLVLDSRLGVLPLMAMPVLLFAGGRLGSGQQGVSWIHIEDEVRAIRFLMDAPQARGPFNLCSPQPLSNAEFIRALAAALKRPYWMPAPGFALRLLLGEMSTLLLDGQYALPHRLASLGFEFRHPRADEALRSLYRAKPAA